MVPLGPPPRLPPPLLSVRRGRAWPHPQRKATGMGDMEMGVGTEGRGDRKGVTDEPSTHIYTHVYTHVHTHIHMWTHIHTCVHIYTRARTHACVHTYTHMCTHIHVHTHMHTYTHVRAHIHTHMCTHMCTHSPVHPLQTLMENGLAFYSLPTVTNDHILGGLKATQMSSLTLLDARSLKSRCRQRWFLLEALREHLSQLLAGTSSPPRSWASRCITPVSASVFTWPSSVCIRISSSYRDTSHWSRAYPDPV